MAYAKRPCLRVSGQRTGFLEPEASAEQTSELITALKQCCRTKELHLGKFLHERVAKQGYTSTIVVANLLVEMYMKCSSVEHAKEAFDRLKHKTTVTWTCLIQGYVDNGLNREALDVFDSMLCQPNHVTLLAALRACSGMSKEKDCEIEKVLDKARAIHKLAEDLELAAGKISITNTLIDVYGKCNKMQLAREAFDDMVTKDVVTWTCLLRGYVDNGDSNRALELFASMDCQPDQLTYATVLKACGDIGDEDSLIHGIGIHEELKQRGFTGHLHLLTSLMDMYSKCGEMRRARDAFESMSHKDVAAWNCLIAGYSQKGESLVALDLFLDMDCRPNRGTYLVVLKSCIELARKRALEKEKILAKAREIHEQIRVSSLDADDIVVACSLMDLYSKCESMPLARQVFDELAARDVATWTCLILGYVDNGESSIALELFTRMDCEPNVVTYVAALKACAGLEDDEMILSKGLAIHQQIKEHGLESGVSVATSLIVMYSRYRQMKLAREVFEKLVYKDVVAWNSLILGYVENGQSREALEVFSSMDCQATPVTYIALLKACGALAEEKLGAGIHGTICKLGLEQDTTVASTLVDLYAKCGSMKAANQVFSSMHSPDVVSWSALLAGYGSIGDTSRVLSFAREIGERGLKLDPVAFICILAACSHTGMLEEGLSWFESMRKHGVRPGVEHYNCMVDMLGRASRVDEAVSVISNMSFQGNQVTWRSLLTACTKLNNKLDVSTTAFENLQAQSPAGYVLMSHVLGNGL